MPRSSWLEKAVSFSVSRALVLALPAVAACSFGGSDGDGDSEDTCYFSYTKLCGLSFNGPRRFTGQASLDTSTNSTCTKVIAAESVPGAPELCVISAQSIDIQADAVIRVTGKRPLVLAAETFLRVAGTIDASSTRARTAAEGGAAPEVLGAGAEALPCTAYLRAPVDSTAGGSGGAGGSFVGRGGGGGAGGGGAGGISNAPVDEATLAFPRGGCRGQTGGTGAGDGDSGTPGTGGPGGGVVYLASRDMLQILETGKIGVNGGGGIGGGARTGGGGGGSGGLIVLEALGSLRHTGLLSANGGGGGGGGYFRNADSTQYAGASGADAAIALARADAGDGQPGGTTGGDGAEGGALGYTDAALGSASTLGGGGGGGGGVGWIHLIAPGPIDGDGDASPPKE